MQDTVKCKYCGEEIKAEALKCKHCGKWLVEQSKSFKKNNIIITTLVLLIVIACSVLVGASKVAAIENIKSSSSNKNVNSYKHGQVSIQTQYPLQRKADINHLFLCKDKDGYKCAYYDIRTKKIITPFIYVGNGEPYRSSTGFSEGYAKVAICVKQTSYIDEVGDKGIMIESRIGYINEAGKIVVPIKYYFGDSFRHGQANVCLDDNCSERRTVDTQGNVFELQYFQ